MNHSLLNGLKFNCADLPPDNKASELAGLIMSSYAIKGLGPETFPITALEFYLFHRDIHPDSAVFCHPMQLTNGKFYIHVSKKSGALKAPNFSGIDISCGNELENIFGGILIRQLGGTGGSGRAIQLLMRGNQGKIEREGNVWTAEEKKILFSLQGSDIFSGPIRLIQKPQTISLKIKSAARIGIKETSMAGRKLRFYYRLPMQE